MVGDDIFAVLEERLRPPGDQWFGYFGYACRPDLPAAARPRSCPTRSGCGRGTVRVFEHAALRGVTARAGTPRDRPLQRPIRARLPGLVTRDSRRPYAAAFATVQEHLHAGNSYEVNLTYRLDPASDLDPVTAYLRLRELNPAPYAGFLQHDVAGARAWLLLELAGALRARSRADRHAGDQADQGHHPARRDAGGGRARSASAWPATPRSAPRT